MRSLSTLLLRFALAFALAFGLGFSAVHAASTVDPGQVCISVGKLMEQGHYSRQKLDDDVSKKLLQMYLETLDYSRLFFTQADIDAMQEKYGNDLDDDLLLGTPDPAIAIFDLYQKRVEERVAKIQDLIAHEKFTFDSDRAVLLNRQKAAWPKDDAEADQLWHDRIEGELLQEKLSLATKAEKKHAK
jgi:carboxyl-terminal processing protease